MVHKKSFSKSKFHSIFLRSYDHGPILGNEELSYDCVLMCRNQLSSCWFIARFFCNFSKIKYLAIFFNVKYIKFKRNLPYILVFYLHCKCIWFLKMRYKDQIVILPNTWFVYFYIKDMFKHNLYDLDIISFLFPWENIWLYYTFIQLNFVYKCFEQKSFKNKNLIWWHLCPRFIISLSHYLSFLYIEFIRLCQFIFP